MTDEMMSLRGLLVGQRSGSDHVPANTLPKGLLRRAKT